MKFEKNCLDSVDYSKENVEHELFKFLCVFCPTIFWDEKYFLVLKFLISIPLSGDSLFGHELLQSHHRRFARLEDIFGHEVEQIDAIIVLSLI